MLIGDVRPTTLDGVKSLAAQLRKEQGIKHASALDLASQAANCANFKHALRILPTRGTAFARPYVLLTTYWYDKEQQHQIGRETLKVELSKPILDICGKSELKHVRGFRGLRMVAGDHFVCDDLAVSQDSARRHLCRAERSLRFMEHTGLRPFHGSYEAYRPYSIGDSLPNSDHATHWFDPVGGQFILVDEPYGDRSDEAERAAWTVQTGWQVAKTSWPGMYSPYDCDLYIATNGGSGYDLGALAAKISAMPDPLVEGNWPGESLASWETFVSPMAKTKQDVRRARCRGTIYPQDSANTVPYHYSFGSSQRRPAGEMGIEGHIEAGRILKAVLQSGARSYAMYDRLNSLRGTLESWMSFEIGRTQLDGREFFEVYYHDAEGDAPYREMAQSLAGIVSMLGDLKQKLQAAYPDCAPLRRQLHRIDMSVSLIGKIQSANA